MEQWVMVSVCADPVSVSSRCLISAFAFLTLTSAHLGILGGHQRVRLLNKCGLRSGLCAPSTAGRKGTKSGHCFSGIHEVWMVASATGADGTKAISVETGDGVPCEGAFVGVTWIEWELGKFTIKQARE